MEDSFYRDAHGKFHCRYCEKCIGKKMDKVVRHVKKSKSHKRNTAELEQEFLAMKKRESWRYQLESLRAMVNE